MLTQQSQMRFHQHLHPWRVAVLCTLFCSVVFIATSWVSVAFIAGPISCFVSCGSVAIRCDLHGDWQTPRFVLGAVFLGYHWAPLFELGKGYLVIELPLWMLWALTMLALLLLQRGPPPTVKPGQHWCAECGYDLTGNSSGVCPECGRRVRGPKV